MGMSVENGQWTNPKLSYTSIDKLIGRIVEKGDFDHHCTNHLTKANVYSAYWYKGKLYAIGSRIGCFGIKVLKEGTMK